MTCSVAACAKPVRARKLCSGHYQRLLRYGDPCGGRPANWARTVQDVWEQVDRRGPNECWPWTGPQDKDGYGDMRISGGPRRAHRIAFLAATGTDPGALVVRHRCDNPPCCNPAHLELGTVADNNRDMHERGRWCDRKGERHPLAKLTAAGVVEIRRRWAAGEAQSRLAIEFGVSRPAISMAVHGTRWGHVE